MQWKLAPEKAVPDAGKMLLPDYEMNDWVNAVVPGTVFNAYVVAGKEKDPNFGDNIYKVDKKKYDQNFWYRTEFTVPATFTKNIIWLNFEGINRKGTVFLNGTQLGTLSGIVQRGKFDISKLVSRDKKNVLAVLISIPEQPLANYGSPTYLSSAGWDWMPYVPGLNSGITDDVYLSNTGNMTLADPWIRTDLPTNARADLSISVEIHNEAATQGQVELEGVIQPGNIRFTKKVNVTAGRVASVSLDKNDFPALSIDQPKLWWPNGYGDPDLYTCHFLLKENGAVSDTQTIRFGIKKYTYDSTGGVLHLAVNGKRIFIKGGDWGMSEYMLRCRGQEYFTKVQLHQQMHMNMIRNWLGSVTDEEFYEACDQYGIMVWDDFWLNANPNLPSDIDAFNRNVIEKIKRERNHPSIAIWCGDNEGWPMPPLNNWIREDIAVYDGGDRHYQPNSHAENLSGSGLWGNHDPKWYFTPYPESMGGTPGWGLRTEIGTAVFPNFESFKRFMPKDKLWPRNEMWNLHFFGQKAFNAAPDNYDKRITECYGLPKGIEDYCRKAQLLNIETNKAMYEGWEDHMWEDASGIMTWMSQSAYPSMVWQTYDYYYDLTGAYWGVKSACEPMHIQWNPLTNAVKVINTTGKDQDDLTATVQVLNPDGREIKSLGGIASLNSSSNTATTCFTIPFYLNQQNLAAGRPVVASSTESGRPAAVTEIDPNTRWASEANDQSWIYVDLQKQVDVNRVVLNWEEAYAQKFKIQISSNAQQWMDVATADGKTGLQTIYFNDVKARYVRMMGIQRATGWGYSLWSFEVFGNTGKSSDLAPVHFIRLTLKNQKGETLSNNFYWRGNKNGDFTALNSLPAVKLKMKAERLDGPSSKAGWRLVVSNPKTATVLAFAVRVKAVNPATGADLLPAIMSSNYFSLFPGETKSVEIEYDTTLLSPGQMPIFTATPYN